MKKNYRIFTFVLALLSGCAAQPSSERALIDQKTTQKTSQVRQIQPEPKSADGLVSEQFINLPLNYPCPEKNCPETLPAIRYSYDFSSIWVKITSDQYGENKASHVVFEFDWQKISAKDEYVRKWSAETVWEITTKVNSSLWQKKCELDELKVFPTGRNIPKSYKLFLLWPSDWNAIDCRSSWQMIAIAFDPSQKIYYEISQWDWCAPWPCTNFTKVEIVK